MAQPLSQLLRLPHLSVPRKKRRNRIPAPASTIASSKPTPAVSSPTRLLIPSIGVDASVENIGVLSNGDLATPTRSPWEDVGWYHLGPRPGENGSAVIAGHLDRPGGAPAVFWNLRNMQPGDIVTVVAASGASLHFRVTQVAAYPPNQAPLQEIFANSGRQVFEFDYLRG